MCGICGIITSYPRPLAPLILAMNNSLAHRGPDDEGYIFANKNNEIITAGGQITPEKLYHLDFSHAPKKNILDINDEYNWVFGHRRLAIIDLSLQAHLPMCNISKNLWITYNGEIYNYIEIKQQLLQKGYQFFTESDTEVILNAYDCWGEECTTHFNGMWAFVIYDLRRNLFFASRDRFGVKPFYYFHAPNFFAFASEHKALLKLPQIPLQINDTAAFTYLLTGLIEQNENGFFNNIKELLPSHQFIYSLTNHQLIIKKYYDLKNPLKKNQKEQQKQIISTIANKIENAIQLRLRSDVPIGFCLSGGLDSSTIVCFSHQIHQQNHLQNLSEQLQTFTAQNNVSDFDETDYAKTIAKYCNVNWNTYSCTADDLIKNLSSIIYHQDIPLSHSSTYAQASVMKLAKQNGIKILLDGQGGDELFAGYQAFYHSWMLYLLTHLQWKSFADFKNNLTNAPTNFTLFKKAAAKYAIETFIPKAFSNIIKKKIKKELQYFNSESIKQHLTEVPFMLDFKNCSINELSYEYFSKNYLKNLLRWEDRCSMQYSIESRTPFADDINLIEYVFQLPSEIKIQQGYSKYLLREAIKNIVPDKIRLRTDKMGFSTPQYYWLMQLKKSIREIISSHSDNLNLIHKTRFLNDFEQLFQADNLKYFHPFIWRYLCLLLWQEQLRTNK